MANLETADTDCRLRRAWGFIVVGLILSLLAAGCQGFSSAGGSHAANQADLEKFLKEKTKSNELLVTILQSITDAGTMRQAWKLLVAHHEREEDLRQRAATLQKPSAESLANLGDYQERMQAALELQKKELRRIQKLPGGDAFVQQLEVFSARRLLPPAQVGDGK